MQTLAWLTLEEAQKDPLLKAIWDKPGISCAELMEQNLIGRSRRRLITMAIDGKVIPKDGGYYPYLPEYLPAANRKQPPLKVWRDPSVIETPARIVAKAISSAVRTAAVQSREYRQENPVVEARAIAVTERRAYDSTARADMVAEKQQQIREIVAQFESEGQPFTLNAVMVRAGLSTGYLHKPVHKELRAEVEAAIARVEAKFSPDQIDTKHLSTAKRAEIVRQRVLDAIAQLEATGQRFSRAQIASVAKVGRGYFSQNWDMRQLADEAVERSRSKPITSETVSEPQPQASARPKPIVTAPSTRQGGLEQAIALVTADRDATTASIAEIDARIQELRRERGYLVHVQEVCDRLLESLGVQP